MDDAPKSTLYDFLRTRLGVPGSTIAIADDGKVTITVPMVEQNAAIVLLTGNDDVIRFADLLDPDGFTAKLDVKGIKPGVQLLLVGAIKLKNPGDDMKPVMMALFTLNCVAMGLFEALAEPSEAEGE
ncbi:hypothetical protein HGA91_00395 [candidate division WWE3 bacterium]|nr:hypothetical protein [candidate division WWE3 bacterium]